MASTTTQAHPQLTIRDKAVEGWNQAAADLAKAQEKRDALSPKTDAHKAAQAEVWSHGGKLANRKAEIRNAEYELSLDGAEYVAWEEPVRPKSKGKTHLVPLTQQEIETSLAKVRAYQASPALSEDHKARCDRRIRDLLKAAKVRGYTVS